MLSTLKSANRLWQSPVSGVLQYAIVMIGLVWLTIEGASEMGYNWQWYQIPRYFYRVIDEELIWGPLATGLVITIEISLYSMLLTLVLGLLTALLRMSNSLSGQVLARVYLETIRNTPMLVQIYVFYFVIAPVLGIDRFWTGVLCLGLFEGSFASEIIRAGINSVPRGQWEAASSVGLSRFSSYRYVVLPQAIPLMLPPMTGVLINLIKHSAIVSVIAVFELTTEGRNIIADTYMAFEVWLTVAGIYLVLTVSLSIFVGYLERRLRQPA
ncbi:MAG TPA: amino acid ABC transporter permease [Gammaproteobacteria bacterium]|nr:amino acid ABC transporter permease [Gammaproteobacteria bacterium]HIL96674.1 amino acid ABC transporter permease [Pseudomonadales bacterium]